MLFARMIAAQESYDGVATILRHIDDVYDCDGIDICDMDNDGKIDIVVCRSTGVPGESTAGVQWYQQGDTPHSWTYHLIRDGGTKLEGILCGDFDDDGDVEVISLDQSSGIVRLYKHTGDPTSGWPQAIELMTGRPNLQDAQAIDIDNDGVVEIVYTWEGDAEGNGGVNWLDFDGVDVTDPDDWTDYVMIQHGGAWWLASSQYDHTLAGNRLDLSGDGNATDIIFSATNLTNRNPACVPGVYWLEEPAGDITGLWTLHTIDNAVADFAHCDFGDFSGAGHGKDVICYDREAGIDPRWYEFNDSWTVHTLAVPDDTPKYFNMSRMPYQTNGRDDILFISGKQQGVESGNGAIYQYQWDGDSYEPTSLYVIDYIHPMDDRIIWYDLNGDGNDDAIIADSGDGSRLIWVKF